MIYTITFNPALDRSVIINDFSAGKVNRIISAHDDPGGKGINVSKIVHVLGGNTVAMGIVGGGTGRFIESSVEACGIETDFVKTDAETRINLKISDPVNHTTTDINAPGAPLTHDLTEQVMLKLLNRLVPGDTVVLAGKIDLNALDIQECVNRIQGAGAKVFLDTEGDALKQGITAAPYLIKPNTNELSMLLGKKTESIEESIKAAECLISEFGISVVIVSMGENGAVCVGKGSRLVSPGVKVSEVCTTGAGDTMLGSFAFGIENNMPTEDTFALSVAASAAAVTCAGSQCPSIEQINELRKQVIIRSI